MVFNICHQCLYGGYGCLDPTRPSDGETELSAQFDELHSKLSSLAKLRSVEIEKYLQEQKKNNANIIKILILGGPSSGKSTIFKQMQIIHSDGFNRADELEYFETLIGNNIRDIYFQFLVGAKKLNEPLAELESCITELTALYNGKLDIGKKSRVGELLEEFWRSSAIQRVFARRYEIELMDSAKYYLENIKRITSQNYTPNTKDIVHSRCPTSHISNIVFTYNGLRLNMIDVGGQRSERRKWLHLFDDARVILFVVDLTGFAKMSDESREEISRLKIFKDSPTSSSAGSSASFRDMKVAVKIFHEIATNRALRHAVFLMFLNKVDLFTDLLPHVSLATCFSKFRDDNTFENTTDFIRQQFLLARPRNSVFSHLTTATNTENMKIVFRACMESVFKENSKSAGIT